MADWDGTSWEPSFGSPLEAYGGGVRREKGWKRKKISMQKRYITVTPDFRPTALNWALFSLDALRRPLGETQRKALPKYLPDRLRTPASISMRVWGARCGLPSPVQLTGSYRVPGTCTHTL